MKNLTDSFLDVAEQVFDALPALCGILAAFFLFPCAGTCTITYAECERECGDLEVSEFHPGYRSMALACSCRGRQDTGD